MEMDQYFVSSNDFSRLLLKLVLEQKYKTESVPYNNVLCISFPLFTFQAKPLPPLKDLDQPAHFLLTVTPVQP